MDCRAAKELLHIQQWLTRVSEIVSRGKRADLQDVLPPAGVDWALAVANRNFLIHQYDEINRQLTWLTLTRDLPDWTHSLEPLFGAAAKTIGPGKA